MVSLNVAILQDEVILRGQTKCGHTELLTDGNNEDFHPVVHEFRLNVDSGHVFISGQKCAAFQEVRVSEVNAGVWEQGVTRRSRRA